LKAIVVYYSGAGSTRKIAKAIHRGMKTVIGDCEIASIKEANPQDMTKYDLIGIGGPIYWFRETANVRLFIYKMPEMEGKLCFPFCTHGSAPSGFMFSIDWALRQKGLQIIGWKDWYGSVYNSIGQPKPYFTDGHPDAIDLKEAEEFGRQMAQRAQGITSGETNLIPEIPKGPEADALWRPGGMAQRRPSTEGQGGQRPAPQPPRTINMKKCTHPECTVCVDNCIFHSIDFSKDPPDFRDNCINCNLCNRMCPVGAIEIDERTKRYQVQKVINTEKCKHPECTICIDHCPMDAIDFSVNPPAYKWSCEQCDLCWVICPQGAIEIANLDTTLDRGRRILNVGHDHPFLKILEDAEARGRFRRLTPLDKIGWDTPVYQIKRTPRFSIEELEKE
jgi:ferredoxin/flavodoxin